MRVSTCSCAKRFILLLSLVLLAAPGARAQSECAGSLILSPGGAVTVSPQRADSVFVADESGNAISTNIGSKVTGATWTPTSSDLAILRQLDASKHRIVFSRSSDGEKCSWPFTVNAPIVAPPPPVSGGVTSTLTGTGGTTTVTSTGGALQVQDLSAQMQACQRRGQTWSDSLNVAATDGARGRTVLVFLDVGKTDHPVVCYMSRDYGVTGDPIHVGVWTSGQVLWRSIRFQPCEIESPENKIYQGSDQFPSNLQSGRFALLQFTERRCYNPAVDVSITGEHTSGTVTQTFRLGQAQRYRATIQLGALWTDRHDETFGLRQRPGGTQTEIFSKGPEGTGTEYFASVVFYSFLRYLPTLIGGDPYPGRDIIHDQGILDRIGLLMGVGLTTPGDRFVAGVTLEGLPGVNVFAGVDYSRVRELSGYKVGDLFSGSESAIPTSRDWEERFVAGISLDLLYAARLFRR